MLPQNTPHRRQVFTTMLCKLGHRLSPYTVNELYGKFEKLLAETIEPPSTPEAVPEVYELKYLHTSSGTGTIPTATVKLMVSGRMEVQEAVWGNGPVDATYNAILKATGVPVQLEDYSSRSVGRGQDAVGEVTVRLTSDGHTAIGRGRSTDLIEAAAKAFLDGLNRLAAQNALIEEDSRAAAK